MDVACIYRLLYWVCFKVSQPCQHLCSRLIPRPNVSVKWIGLFVTALVGLYTVEDLWDKFGDLRMSVVSATDPLFIFIAIDMYPTLRELNYGTGVHEWPV